MADETANPVTTEPTTEVATEPTAEEAPKKTEEEVFYAKTAEPEEEKKVEEPQVKVDEVKEPPKEEVKTESKIELKMPDDSQLTQDEFEAIKKESVNKGLNLDQTQDLLNKLDIDRKQFLDRKAKELKDRSSTWLEELRNDKDIGGDHFNRNVELAKRFVTRFFPDDVKMALDETGLGNHPGLVRGFVRAAQAMAEDELIITRYSPKAKQKTAEEILYGPQTKKH